MQEELAQRQVQSNRRSRAKSAVLGLIPLGGSGGLSHILLWPSKLRANLNAIYDEFFSEVQRTEQVFEPSLCGIAFSKTIERGWLGGRQWWELLGKKA
jgi:hypothetical protein